MQCTYISVLFFSMLLTILTAEKKYSKTFFKHLESFFYPLINVKSKKKKLNQIKIFSCIWASFRLLYKSFLHIPFFNEKTIKISINTFYKNTWRVSPFFIIPIFILTNSTHCIDFRYYIIDMPVKKIIKTISIK